MDRLSLRSPRPSSQHRAVVPATCAHRRPRPLSSRPSAQCPLSNPPRCAPSSRSSIGFPSSSDAGSRCFFSFFVDEGAWITVASTIVPVVIRIPLLSRYRFTCPVFDRTVRALPADGGNLRSLSRPAPGHGPDQCQHSGAAPAMLERPRDWHSATVKNLRGFASAPVAEQTGFVMLTPATSAFCLAIPFRNYDSRNAGPRRTAFNFATLPESLPPWLQSVDGL